MKKIILSVAFIFSVSYLFAQEGDVIQLQVAQKKYEDAKTQVDKWLAQPKIKDKDKATALLWKLGIYSQLSVDSSLSTKYPDAASQALDAFAQYQQMDPTLKQLKEQNFAYGLGNIYAGNFDKGKNFFQGKQYDSAFKYFSQAQRLGTFLLDNKLSSTNSTIDTITVLYTGYSAQNSKQFDSAAKYYSILADAKLAGNEYEDMYKFLVEYYMEQKNTESFTKYLAISKELYPNDASTWTQYEMSNMTANSSLTDLLAKYQQEAAAGTMSEDKLIGYAEAFATTDKEQLEKLDSTQKISLKMAAAQAFGKAFELNNSNGLYAFNTGVIYYSLYGEMDDRYAAYRGETAALKAKRAEIAKVESAYADTASEWLEKAYPVLKAKTGRSRAETTSLNRTVDYLATIYGWKRDQTKSNGQTKDYDKYDALYKKYDAEHNTYQ